MPIPQDKLIQGGIMDLKDKTFVITGIGDFVGLRAAEMAIERGMKVRGLESCPEKASKAEKLGAEVIVGSINDKQALKKACQGGDIVFHTISVLEPSGSMELFRSVNVDGTIRTAQVAQSMGVKSFVHLSTVMVYGFRFPKNVTESGSLRGENNPCCQTKIESETEILKFNNPNDFGVIIIRAGDVYGPEGDVWVTRPLKFMRQKNFVLADGGRGIISYVYLDNLIDAVFLAVEKEAYGEAFNITDGHQITWKEYCARLAEIVGMPKPALSMPAMLLKTAIRSQGKNFDILPESVDFITRPHAYSIEKARSYLGYEPKILLDEGMALTAKWLQNQAMEVCK